MAEGRFLSHLLQTSQELLALGTNHANLLSTKYREFVLHNPDTASKVESILRALSYILPGRFGASEALAELVFSSSQLLTLLNDGILRDRKDCSQGGSQSSPKQRVLLWLTVVEYLEVFIELGAFRLWGEIGKWIVVLVLQITKAALRFVLLFKYNSGVQRTPHIPPLDRSKLVTHEDETDRENGEEEEAGTSAGRQHEDTAVSPGPLWRGARSGRLMRSLNATPTGGSRTWTLPKESSTKKRATQPTHLSSKRLFAESLYISRPLVHIASMFLCGQLSWKPWLISCGVDVTSLALMGDLSDLNDEEKSELSRRTLLLLFYFLRSPFYDNYSKVRILGFLKFMSDTIPGVSLVVAPLLDYLPTWQKIYFYNWTS